ncbi:MAG: MoxR family ATPase [Candidatus Electrothrix sp. AUS1_2]|nr:MoxR family ATPase [Candidatus Electrothrix sp. AUS1_2]
MLRQRPARRPEDGDGENSEGSLAADARRFVPGRDLEDAINTAIAVNEPLLITGEPGTGKTTAAYYTAWKLGLGKVLHFQVKSETVARDLLYHFDTVRYFHDAHLAGTGQCSLPDKKAYIEKRQMWHALTADRPCLLLIDEIDKAPRDFPNDLLHELHEWNFTIPETGEEISCKPDNQPIVFITSNSEHRLPEPFLRRCVYHHIRFDQELIHQIVESRQDEYPALDEGFRRMAVDRFLRLRESGLRKRPASGELLVWLRILGLRAEEYPRFDEDLAELPHLGVLIKDHQDMEDIKKNR